MNAASELVTAFIKAIELGDLDAALALVTDDVVYDNVPFGPVVGPDQIRTILGGGITRAAEKIEWIVTRQVAEGDVVMNERVDRFLINGMWLEISVAGVFVLREGRIALWRDFFDVTAFNREREKVGLAHH